VNQQRPGVLDQGTGNSHAVHGAYAICFTESETFAAGSGTRLGRSPAEEIGFIAGMAADR
jgi:hypothetical protein